MDGSRDDALREIDDLLKSAKRLRGDLRAKEASYRRMASQLEKGTGIGTAMAALGAPTARQELTDRLDEFERCRHRARLAITAAGLSEGLSIGDIGRAWGFSRQLAARYAKEARDSK
jgi:hypothetical protein